MCYIIKIISEILVSSFTSLSGAPAKNIPIRKFIIFTTTLPSDVLFACPNSFQHFLHYQYLDENREIYSYEM